MVSAGELTTSGDGRYELTGHLRSRQARQDQSRAGSTDPNWDGSWNMAVVTADGRTPAERAELRVTMRRLRLGELREGVWLRPSNLLSSPPADEAGQIEQWVTDLRTFPAHPQQTVARLWDLEQWTATAVALAAELAAALTQLRPTDIAVGDREIDLGRWFIVNAAVLRHLQGDPLLPSALLPENWHGSQLREIYERFDELFLRRWRSWLTE
jgi:phenylacetic acid degradation operon negative regulatory protein